MDTIKLVSRLKQGGFTIEEAADIVTWGAGIWKYNRAKALDELDGIYQQEEGSLTQRIKDYVETTQGYFHAQDCDKDLNLKPSDREKRRVIISRLVPKILERHPSKNGIFRRIENECAIIEWEEADIANVFSINWPFELENHVLMYPKNIAVIAGSPNAGKTAFLLNVIKMNMANNLIHYFSSEMGAEELKLRLSKFEGNIKWVFDPKERSTKFADVIYPDDINIIDYIETSKEIWLVGEELRAIFDKLNKGIAIIALQKKRGAELGRRAEFSLEKPRIYLSMDAGKLTIIKGKNWSVEGMNPNNMEFTFSLINGAKFVY